MADQLDLFEEVTPEQACIMCHLSSECPDCCNKCRAEGRSGDCYGQCCSQPSRGIDAARWRTWFYLVGEYKEFNDIAHRVLTKEQIRKCKIKKL